MLKKAIFALGCVLWAFNGAPAAVAEETPSVQAARAWLALIDKGQYEYSWMSASDFFKSMTAKDQWTRVVNAVRNPLGIVTSRELKTQQPSTSLPGLPDGEYDVLIFDTVFQNKAAATEMVTVTKEKDGEWRVTGYIIR